MTWFRAPFTIYPSDAAAMLFGGLLEIMAAKPLCRLFTRSGIRDCNGTICTASAPIDGETNMGWSMANFPATACPYPALTRRSKTPHILVTLKNSKRVGYSLKSSSLLRTVSGITCCLSSSSSPPVYVQIKSLICYGASQGAIFVISCSPSRLT
jgi:hypothetical protein